MCDMVATNSLMLRNNIILKHHLVSTSAFLVLLAKTLDNNENYVKNTNHLKQISSISNVTLQIIVQFYFFNRMNVNSSFHDFCHRS